MGGSVSKNENEVINEESKVSVTTTDVLTALQVEIDDQRSALAAEYNEVLTNKESSVEEKNNAYNNLKELDGIKAKEELIEKKLKEQLKLESFVKVESDSVNVTITKKDHDYSLANKIMRLVQEEFENKMYVSVKFEN